MSNDNEPKTQKSLLGDVPIEFSSNRVDQLKFGNHATVLADAVTETEDPITIGVFGKWGTGKTSLMKLIQKKVEENEKAVPVWFNAWQYEREEHLIIPLIATIQKEINERIDSKKWGETFKKVAKSISAALRSVAYGFSMKGKVSIPLLSEAQVNLSGKDVIARYQQIKEEFTKDLILDQSLYFKAFEELNKSTKNIGSSIRIVVFIDDLDRCFPEKAVELLEGVKLILNLPGFSFVLGVYEEIIRDFVVSKYSEKCKISRSYFDNYLDKIVQVKIPVPEREPDAMKDYIEDLIGERNVFKTEDIPKLTVLIAEVSKRNPRSIIRLLNRVMFAMRICKLEGGDPYEPAALVLHLATDSGEWIKFKNNLESPAGKLVIEKIKKYKDSETEIEVLLNDKKGLDLGGVMEQHYDNMVELLLKHTHVLAVFKTETGIEWLEDKEFRLRHGAVSEQTIGETKESTVQVRKKHFKIKMIKIKGSTFTMGDGSDENNPAHEVKVNSFRIQETPVTQQQYEDIMGENPSKFKGDDLSVEQVSWWDAIKCCNAKSEKEGLTPCYNEKTGVCNFEANGYRLPTEAEWECACRAGTTGDRYGELDKIAWYKKNSEGKTHPVGQKEPNEFGLYDMLGNVWEWCYDWYDEDCYKNSSPSDPTGPGKGGGSRVYRGGSWFFNAGNVRAAYRLYRDPSRRLNGLGFRFSQGSKQ